MRKIGNHTIPTHNFVFFSQCNTYSASLNYLLWQFDHLLTPTRQQLHYLLQKLQEDQSCGFATHHAAYNHYWDTWISIFGNQAIKVSKKQQVMELRFVRVVFCLDIFFLTKKSLKYMMWLLQLFVLPFLCSFFWNMLRKGRNSLSNLHVLLKMLMVDRNMILAALAFWWVMFNKKLEIELSINGRRYWYVLQPAGIPSCKGSIAGIIYIYSSKWEDVQIDIISLHRTKSTKSHMMLSGQDSL